MDQSSSKYIIETTADGSSTIYLPDLDEHYHSIKGALAESLHIYIDCAFRYRQATHSAETPLRILEIGFGTGLNAALTIQAATKTPVIYSSIELYPISDSQVKALNYDQWVDAQLFTDLHSAPWDTPVEIRPGFTLHKIHGDFLTCPLPTDQDVIYYDAFAPEKQPELWDINMLSRIYNTMAPQAVLTTYCAKGAIRRLLAELGLTVQRLPGPPQGKREILRAIHP